MEVPQVSWEIKTYDRNAYQWIREERWLIEDQAAALAWAVDLADSVRRSPPPGYCVWGSARRGGYTFKPDGSAGLTIREVKT